MSPQLPDALDLIAGRLQAPTGSLDGWICDSNTGARLMRQAETGPGAVELALATAASGAGNAWTDAPAAKRAAAMARIADALESRVDAIAEADARTTGVIVRLTRMFAAIAQAAFRAGADLAVERDAPTTLPGPMGKVSVHRVALGPAAVIAPWNAPAVIAAHKVASALAAGCPVILKPSELAPTSCELLAAAIHDADLPAGAFQLVHGDAAVGGALVADPRIRVVSFTGGLSGGRSVAAACADGMKPAQLELGGNNPLVVLEGADVEAAADGVIEGMTTMGGQWCRALGRLIVHRTLREPLLAAIETRLAGLVLGSSLDPGSEMGPMAHPAHLAYIEGAIESLRDAGGTAHQFTPVPDAGGWFVAPTLVTGVAADKARGEIFGPVATVHEFDSADEAMALAIGSDYGLAAYVFGPEAEARRMGVRIRAGVVKLNGVSLLSLSPRAPRPAWGLSGLGDEGSIETFEHFRGSRVVGAAGSAPTLEVPA